jgi:hypothetical protein
MQDEMQPLGADSAIPASGPDREGAMARADLYKCANYSLKLFKKLSDEDQLEAWVQAKITKAADYIASVYHYLEYEMKFSEYGHHLDNSDTLSEDQKAVLKGKLLEAKDKIKALKISQADKKDKKEKEVKEEKSSTGGEITRSKNDKGQNVTKHTQNPNRFSDEPHTEPKSQAKSQSAAEKAGDKAADKADEKEGKNWEKRFGKGSVTRVKDGKKVAEGAKPDFNDVDNDGDEKESWTKAEKDKKKAPFKKVKESLKGDQKKLDTDNDDDIDKKDLATLRAKKEKKVDEAKAKPSAGMTAKEKSATVKKAKAGGDIGKPGKDFDKVAKAAGGGEKGTKIAAAAMWKGEAKKNVKEAIAKAKKTLDKDLDEVQSPFPSRNAPPAAEPTDKEKAQAAARRSGAIMPSRGKEMMDKANAMNESVELDRMKTLMTRLNG